MGWGGVIRPSTLKGDTKVYIGGQSVFADDNVISSLFLDRFVSGAKRGRRSGAGLG
jgi:hypothetical protein